MIRDRYRALRGHMLAQGGTEEEAARAIDWVLGAIRPTVENGSAVSIPDFGRLSVVTVKAPKGKYISPGPKLVYSYRRFSLQSDAQLEVPVRQDAAA